MFKIMNTKVLINKLNNKKSKLNKLLMMIIQIIKKNNEINI